MEKKVKIKKVTFLPSVEEPKALYLARELSLLFEALNDHGFELDEREKFNGWVTDIYSGKVKVKNIDEKIAFVKSAEDAFIEAKKSKCIGNIVYRKKFLIPALYGLVNVILNDN